ncbi:hypothetical protein GCM10010977_29140 [Citricoccus zhacaiensis]|nr:MULTISPECIES: hypothetical protein [Citricoccus]GGO48772.1 hypothetical protein GCM10010977_29140 [Citricoccus zhacaiensis]VXC17098.1 conserved exported hypothetical protein [Citricoccus sp. K5]
MNRTRILTYIAITAVAVLVGVGVALAFTQPWNREAPAPTTAPTSAATSTGAPDDSVADDISDRQQIALEAARIMTTWTPDEDLNRTAAELRARTLMTKERAAAVIAPERPATGVEWLEAAERGATSVPNVELNYATESSETGVSVTATWTWNAPDGSDIPEEPGTQPRRYYFEFTEENKIHDYSY